MVEVVLLNTLFSVCSIDEPNAQSPRMRMLIVYSTSHTDEQHTCILYICITKLCGCCVCMHLLHAAGQAASLFCPVPSENLHPLKLFFAEAPQLSLASLRRLPHPPSPQRTRISTSLVWPRTLTTACTPHCAVSHAGGGPFCCTLLSEWGNNGKIYAIL